MSKDDNKVQPAFASCDRYRNPVQIVNVAPQGVLDYFGVTADEAPTIYMVTLKEQMLK